MNKVKNTLCNEMNHYKLQIFYECFSISSHDMCFYISLHQLRLPCTNYIIIYMVYNRSWIKIRSTRAQSSVRTTHFQPYKMATTQGNLWVFLKKILQLVHSTKFIYTMLVNILKPITDRFDESWSKYVSISNDYTFNKCITIVVCMCFMCISQYTYVIIKGPIHCWNIHIYVINSLEYYATKS